MSTESESEGNERGDDGQIPAETRERVKDRDGFRCQLCGEAGPETGGVAVLHVHHKSSDPDDCEYHDAGNLITLCWQCHSWFHNRPKSDEVPVALSADAEDELLPHDFELLHVLASSGPLSTSDVTKQLSTEHSTSAVRDRLCVLMGLDTVVDSQDEQVIDQDAQTDEWGLCEDISQSKRGRIPEDRTTLIQRVEDERVRRALARGQSRDDVADTFDMTPRTTWYKQRRAQAYAFPLDAFTQHGRPSASTEDTTETSDSECDSTASKTVEDGEPDETWPASTTETDENDRGGGEGVVDGEVSTSTGNDAFVSEDCDVEKSMKVRLQEAIAALQRVEEGF